MDEEQGPESNKDTGKNQQSTFTQDAADFGDDSPRSLAQRIKASANQIWLAGLGAFAKAEKGGERLFDALVQDGEETDRLNKEEQSQGEAAAKRLGQGKKDPEKPESSDATVIDEGEVDERIGSSPLGAKIDQQISAYRELVEERVEDVKDRATSSWEKLERAFDERVSRALGRLNIPTKADVEALAERIDALSAAIAKIAANTPAQNGSSKPAEDTTREDS